MRKSHHGGAKAVWAHDFILTQEEFDKHGFMKHGKSKKGDQFAAIYVGIVIKGHADPWDRYAQSRLGDDTGKRYYAGLRLENGTYALKNGRVSEYSITRDVSYYNKKIAERLKPEGELIHTIDGVEFRRGDMISYEPEKGWGGVIFRLVGGGKKCATARPVFQLCRTFDGNIEDACSTPIQVRWEEVKKIDLQVLMEEAQRIKILVNQELKRQARVMEMIAKEKEGG